VSQHGYRSRNLSGGYTTYKELKAAGLGRIGWFGSAGAVHAKPKYRLVSGGHGAEFTGRKFGIKGLRCVSPSEKATFARLLGEIPGPKTVVWESGCSEEHRRIFAPLHFWSVFLEIVQTVNSKFSALRYKSSGTQFAVEDKEGCGSSAGPKTVERDEVILYEAIEHITLAFVLMFVIGGISGKDRS
jgi:hypothetical protein